MEYYGYKPKDIDKSYIDWAGITKGISEEIRSVAKERQDQRNELEKEHFKQLQALNEFEQGMDPSANNVILRAGQGSRDLLTQLNRQMKAGLKTPEEVKIIQQNISDNFSSLNSTLKAVNTQIQSLAEAEGKGNEAVIDEIRRIINLGENTIVPDPETGELFLVGKKDDGNIDSSTARPLRALSNIVGQKFDFVDVEAESKKIADDAGVWKQTFANGLTIEDARKNPDYSSWIFNVVKSKMNTDEKMASVLLDYDNQEYTTTGEEGKIQLEFDRSVGKMVPKLTDAQRKRAKHVFEHAIEAKIGAVRKEPKAEKPTDEMIITGLINDFISTGDFSNLANALTNKGYTGANMSNDVLSITLPNGVKRSAKLKPGMSGKEVGQNIASLFGLTKYKTITGEQEFEANPGVFDIGTYKPITTGEAPKAGKIDRTALNNLSRSLTVDTEMNEKVNPVEVLQYSQLLAKGLGVDEKLIMIDDAGTVLVNGVSAGNINDGTATSSNILSRIEDVSSKSGASDWTGIDPTKF
jgi:hypothetical protein